MMMLANGLQYHDSSPDRTPRNPEERDPRPGTGDAMAGDDATSEAAEASSSADGPPSLFDQLKDSDFDLTGHPLAKKFESLPAVPTGDHEEPLIRVRRVSRVVRALPMIRVRWAPMFR